MKEGDRRELNQSLSQKTSATPQVPGLVRASSRNVREMNGSVSPAIHMVSALFFSPLACTTYHINISQGLVSV